MRNKNISFVEQISIWNYVFAIKCSRIEVQTSKCQWEMFDLFYFWTKNVFENISIFSGPYTINARLLPAGTIKISDFFAKFYSANFELIEERILFNQEQVLISCLRYINVELNLTLSSETHISSECLIQRVIWGISCKWKYVCSLAI